MVSESQTIKILLIGDDRKGRSELRKELQMAHFDVIMAEDENEGLQIVSMIQPDLIIMDISKSHLLGFILLEELKSKSATRSIPVIHLTEKNYRPSMEDFEEGPVYFEQKPYRLHELQASIRRAIRARDERHKILLELQRVKNDTVALLARELRFPVSIIAGFTKMMQDQSFYSKIPVSPDYARFINQQSDHLKDLLEDFNYLLHADPSLEEVNLISVVEAAMNRFRNSIERKEQKLSLKIHGESNLVVCGKSHHLFMALRHLISNAHKFTPRGGEISVTIIPQNGYIRVAVTDNGVGIPVSQQQLIAKKFNNGLKIPVGLAGNGLGLAIIRSVTDQHRGNFGFKSHPGLGSCFWIELPTQRLENGPCSPS